MNLTIHHSSGPAIATMTVEISRPMFQLFDQVMTRQGKAGIVTGVCVIFFKYNYFWRYFVSGPEVDPNVSHFGNELAPIELGNIRRRRIKKPAFKLFDRVRSEGSIGFINGVELIGSGKSAQWEYNVWGAGVNQDRYFTAEELELIAEAIAA